MFDRFRGYHRARYFSIRIPLQLHKNYRIHHIELGPQNCRLRYRDNHVICSSGADVILDVSGLEGGWIAHTASSKSMWFNVVEHVVYDRRLGLTMYEVTTESVISAASVSRCKYTRTTDTATLNIRSAAGLSAPLLGQSCRTAIWFPFQASST